MSLLAAKSVWIVKTLIRGIFREFGRELGQGRYLKTRQAIVETRKSKEVLRVENPLQCLRAVVTA
jgi:hypothetical protein